MHRLGVCLLFHNKVGQTMECVRSILTTAEVPIYILNNASDRRQREELGAFCARYPQISIIDSETNLGVGRGRNRLIASTVEPWLFFLDNDITISSIDWLETVLGHLDEAGFYDAFVPHLYNLHEKSYAAYRFLELRDGAAAFVLPEADGLNCFPGGAAVVSRGLFERTGPYDEEIFVGLEDFELALRAIRQEQPIRAKLVRGVELLHDHRPVTDAADEAAVRIRYDAEIIQKSVERVHTKHGIRLPDDWREWVQSQVRQLLGTPAERSEKKAAPASCTLYLTDQCNFRCAGCKRTMVGVHHFRHMRPDAVKRLLKLYPQIGGFCVAGLGEPTLNPSFREIIDYLKAVGKYVGIVTNGTVAETLLDLKDAPDYISISLYGSDGDAYQEYCGVDAFDKVIDNFRVLKAKYKNVGFSHIVNRSNYRSLPRVLALCDALEPDFLHLTNYLAFDAADRENFRQVITTADTDVIQSIQQCCKGRDYIKIMPQWADFASTEFHCPSYCSSINLDGSGNIGGCQRQIPPQSMFGNVWDDEDPFNSDEMMRLRSRATQGKYPHVECASCFGRFIKAAGASPRRQDSEERRELRLLLRSAKATARSVEARLSRGAIGGELAAAFNKLTDVFVLINRRFPVAPDGETGLLTQRIAGSLETFITKFPEKNAAELPELFATIKSDLEMWRTRLLEYKAPVGGDVGPQPAVSVSYGGGKADEYLQGNNYFIKPRYRSRTAPNYFEDNPGEIVYQPEVYPLAQALAETCGCEYIIDIGCGQGAKLAKLHPRHKIIGIDYGVNLAVCRAKYPFGQWNECDLDRPAAIAVDSGILRRAVIVCSDVVEHLVNPEFLLDNLAALMQTAPACLISTPERDLTRGVRDEGPPVNPAHIREWNIEEFKLLLGYYGFRIREIGLTTSDNASNSKKTILAVCEKK